MLALYEVSVWDYDLSPPFHTKKTYGLTNVVLNCDILVNSQRHKKSLSSSRVCVLKEASISWDFDMPLEFKTWSSSLWGTNPQNLASSRCWSQYNFTPLSENLVSKSLTALPLFVAQCTFFYYFLCWMVQVQFSNVSRGRHIDMGKDKGWIQLIHVLSVSVLKVLQYKILICVTGIGHFP